ncbi:uncharacterized protein [Argopecten irradians]|uniref:uncharacterized protein isoform X1 n=1 Tax=Argopecten irradians TaxID=31199 RepID=UPI003716A1E6
MLDWIVNTKLKARVWRSITKKRSKSTENGTNDTKDTQVDQREGEVTDETDRPPPLPPRKPSKEGQRCTQQSCSGPARQLRRDVTRDHDGPSQREHLGHSWPRHGKGMADYKTKYSSETDIMSTHSLHARRKRHNFTKKKHDPCIILSRSSSTSSSNGSLDEHASTNGNDITPSPDINMNHFNARGFELNGNYVQKSKSCETRNQNVEYLRQHSNEEVRRGGLEVPSIRHSHSDASLQSLRSCPEMSRGSSYEFDINSDIQSPCYGRDYNALIKHMQKSPFRRKEQTPPSKPFSSFDVNEVDSVARRERASRRMPQRPHSIGYFENNRYNKVTNVRRQLTVGGRISDPNQCHSSPASPLQKRMPLVLQDDPGSVSDLEYIMESPHEMRSFDVSRENSLVSEEEVSKLCGDLRRLTTNNENENGYVKVLASPRVSPDIFHSVPGVVVTSDSDETSDSQNGKVYQSHKGQNFLSVPKKTSRRKSSLSLTSGSEESDCEPSPPLSRRGRRAAIVDTKNFGDVSPTNLSPEVSPSNSCDEGEGASNIAQRLRRRRSSVELAMSIYPGDLLVQEHHKKLLKRNTVADFHALRHGSSSTSTINDVDAKKGRQSFSLLKLMKSRSKEALSKLEDVLAGMKPSEFKDNYLAVYKSLHWSDLIASSDKQTEQMCLSETERKRREAVWELFKSECVFLIDHLMVLKHCFMEPLKKVQVEGHLMYAEPQDLFGNLDEICYVSYTFCKDFIAALLKGMSSTEFGSTRVLLKAFERFSTHSKDGDIYHTYCLNYTNALTYLEKLRRHDDFTEFERWCEQDTRCKRLQLTDLLVAPMQHCTKLPLLLGNIRKYTECDDEIGQLTDSIERVEMSLQNMEEKIKWVKNYERVQEVQRQLLWPPVTELEPRVFIPEYLKNTLLKQPCERLLACPQRQLLHEGQLTLVESTKATEVYLFLFDDILLITRVKKSARKKQAQLEVTGTQTSCDKITYTVHKQPVALDRLSVHDISQSEAAANGVKCAFVIVQISRFQQIIGVYTLQSPTDAAKNAWLEKLGEAREKFTNKDDSNQDLNTENVEARENRQSRFSEISFSPPRRQRKNGTLKSSHTKALSVDSVYI